METPSTTSNAIDTSQPQYLVEASGMQPAQQKKRSRKSKTKIIHLHGAKSRHMHLHFYPRRRLHY